MDLLATDISEAEKVEKAIRKAADIQNGTMRILSETSRGTRVIDEPSSLGKEVRRGDYLRIIHEDLSGDLRESIHRLT